VPFLFFPVLVEYYYGVRPTEAPQFYTRYWRRVTHLPVLVEYYYGVRPIEAPQFYTRYWRRVTHSSPERETVLGSEIRRCFTNIYSMTYVIKSRLLLLHLK
jgi:hypothetical protein